MTFCGSNLSQLGSINRDVNLYIEKKKLITFNFAINIAKKTHLNFKFY